MTRECTSFAQSQYLQRLDVLEKATGEFWHCNAGLRIRIRLYTKKKSYKKTYLALGKLRDHKLLKLPSNPDPILQKMSILNLGLKSA